MNDYRSYYLRDNPFPGTPVLDPNSEDDRINGMIYNPNIMIEEIQSFTNKINHRPPLIYIENREFQRGVGKSALLAQQWRLLQKRPSVTSVYLRSEQKLKPADFASRVISYWHQRGYLWPVVLHALDAYVKANPHGQITRAGAEQFAQAFPRLPQQSISLRNFNVFNPDQLITDLATWAHRQVGDSLHPDLARIFFHSYLTDPRTFPKSYPTVLHKHKWDHIRMLNAVYRLLKLGGFEYNYLFFDQFELLLPGLSRQALFTFSSEMRRLIEASIGYATLSITLHPDARQTLDAPEASEINSIAPPDQNHMVEVRPLTKEGASQLAQTYLEYFRLDESPPPDTLYPFTTEAIAEIFDAAERSPDGNIRFCLRAFNRAIYKGIAVDSPVIDKAFLDKYHSDITGYVHIDAVDLSR